MNKKTKKSQDTNLTIEAIQDFLSNDMKASFFNLFWKTWSTNGFGTLTKKDTELLIFGCLKKALGDNAPCSNYEWARFLRLTPSRVRTVLLESHMRFGHLLDEDEAQNVLDKLLMRLESVDLGDFEKAGDLTSVKVQFLVEDPVLQLEVDRKVKEVGGYINYLRNREVVVLRLLDFFRIISPETKQQSIDKWVVKAAEESKETEALRSRVQGKKFSNLSSIEQLGEFASDLAELAGGKVLTDRLKLIAASSAERSKK